MNIEKFSKIPMKNVGIIQIWSTFENCKTTKSVWNKNYFSVKQNLFQSKNLEKCNIFMLK